MDIVSKEVYLQIKDMAKTGVPYTYIAEKFSIGVTKVIEIATTKYEVYYDVIDKGCTIDMLCVGYNMSRTLACRVMRSYKLHKTYILGYPEEEVLHKPSPKVSKIISMVKNNMDIITISRECYCKAFQIMRVIEQYSNTLLKGYDTSKMLSSADIKTAYSANDIYNMIKYGSSTKKISTNGLKKNIKMEKDIAFALKDSKVFRKYTGILDESKRDLIRNVLVDITNNIDFIIICRKHKIPHSYLKLIFNRHRKVLETKYDVSHFLYPEDIEVAYLFNNVYTTYKYKGRKLSSYEIAAVNGNRRIIEVLNLSKKQGILISGRSQ